MKVYFVRHQAAGVVHQFPFAQEPSAEQVALVREHCAQSFGTEHDKLGEFWTKVVSVDVLGPGEMPVVIARGVANAGVAPVGEFTVRGVATVTPAEGGA